MASAEVDGSVGELCDEVRVLEVSGSAVEILKESQAVCVVRGVVQLKLVGKELCILDRLKYESWIIQLWQYTTPNSNNNLFKARLITLHTSFLYSGTSL